MTVNASANHPAALHDAALVETWVDAWADLGRAVPLALRLELHTAWAEPHRRYHGTEHLRECMALWRLWQDQCERPGEVALALWFHDAVHDPQESGNELRSASWAARSLVTAGVAESAAQRVYDLVLATRHDRPPDGQDARLVVDIDLAIFGSPMARFERYDQDIRKEYEFVPGYRYRSQRALVLQSFLDRSPLYQTPLAQALLESQARINLSAAISRLAQ